MFRGINECRLKKITVGAYFFFKFSRKLVIFGFIYGPLLIGLLALPKVLFICGNMFIIVTNYGKVQLMVKF